MPRTPGARAIPWDDIVQRLRKYPGRWMLLPEMRSVRPRTIEVIRRRERRQLRLDDGKIYCRVRAATRLDDGSERCTLVLRFVPKHPEGESNGNDREEHSTDGR